MPSVFLSSPVTSLISYPFMQIKPWVCNDQQAVAACLKFAEDHRVLVEPACGAALAAVYTGYFTAQGSHSILVELVRSLPIEDCIKVCFSAAVPLGLFTRCPELERAESVVVEVCGGAIATPSMMESWKQECGL